MRATFGAEVVLDVLQTQGTAMVFDGVVQERRDDHVFGDRKSTWPASPITSEATPSKCAMTGMPDPLRVSMWRCRA